MLGLLNHKDYFPCKSSVFVAGCYESSPSDESKSKSSYHPDESKSSYQDGSKSPDDSSDDSVICRDRSRSDEDFPDVSQSSVKEVRPTKHPRHEIIDPENVKLFGPIKEGKKVNIESLLSSRTRDYLVDGKGEKVKVSTLKGKGKFIIVPCFELPVDSSSCEGQLCWALRSVLSSKKWRDHVQLVVVAKMSPGWENDTEAFASFLSGFPSCLAIPIWDSISYDRVSGLIGDGIVLDPTEVVLQYESCDCVTRFGADSYPFTDDHLWRLEEELVQLKSLEGLVQPVRLDDLLCLGLSDFLYTVEGNDMISVSDLKKKLVGLYLCLNGLHMHKINQAFQECKAAGRELEIVLVCLAFSDDPQHFVESAIIALKNMGISSWWVLPYDDTRSRKLWRLCDESCADELIIVGPYGEYFELRAVSAIHFGYPYAAEPIARQETQRLKKLTMESLFTYLLTRAGEQICVADLRGKVVVLFVSMFDENYFDTSLEEMENWYNENKGHHKGPNIKLVFVPLNASKNLNFTANSDPKMRWLSDPALSWLICPPDPDREASIIKHLTFKSIGFRRKLSFIAFGENGEFISIARPVLSNRETSALLLSGCGAGNSLPDRLYQDVLEQYTDILDAQYCGQY